MLTAKNRVFSFMLMMLKFGLLHRWFTADISRFSICKVFWHGPPENRGRATVDNEFENEMENEIAPEQFCLPNSFF